MAQSFPFVANSATTTLTFRDTSTTTWNVDLMLDNVQILPQGAGHHGAAADPTVAQNSPASFTVTATGAGLAYQWRFGGAPIGGATGSTYAIASAQPSQAGNYDVVVNLAGSVTSAIATLTVHTPPVITGQPQTRDGGAEQPGELHGDGDGARAGVSVAAGGVPIGGATGATYTIASAQPNQAGTYDVVVQNGGGP